MPAPVKGVCAVVILFHLFIAQGVVGGKYMDDCPEQPFIPIYLMVMGGSILLFFLKDLNLVCFGVVSVFYFFWFIAGNFCIYHYKPNYDEDCNKTLYLFAFWSTNFTDVLLGFIFCSFCCDKLKPDTEAQMPVQV